MAPGLSNGGGMATGLASTGEKAGERGQGMARGISPGCEGPWRAVEGSLGEH